MTTPRVTIPKTTFYGWLEKDLKIANSVIQSLSKAQKFKHSNFLCPSAITIVTFTTKDHNTTNGENNKFDSRSYICM
jgi:hypothetical protein